MRARIEQRDRSRTDMRAGDRLIVDRDAFAGKAALPQLVLQKCGVLRGVGMGNADRAAAVCHKLIITLRQREQRLLSAAALAAENDLSLGIAGEQRLDLEHCADDACNAADASAALEIFEVVDREILSLGVADLCNRLDDLAQSDAFLKQLRSLQHKQTLAK